jgi:hypothetical protein
MRKRGAASQLSASVLEHGNRGGLGGVCWRGGWMDRWVRIQDRLQGVLEGRTPGNQTKTGFIDSLHPPFSGQPRFVKHL